MSNERLERIKERVNYHGHLDDDIEFLIEQAEQVQKLKEIKNNAINQIDVTQERNKRLEKRVQELEEKRERYQSGRNVAVATKMKMDDLEEQNKRYRETIKSVRSEIKYALYSNKSEDVKRHYLQNAEREATEALEESE